MKLSTPILGQSTVLGFRNFAFLIYQYLLSIVVIAAAVVFVWAGFKYIIGATTGDIQSAKEMMVNATVGLLLTFGATMILRTVNPATTTFEALKVYLINKQEFSLTNSCELIKGDKKFMWAGQPPGSIPFETDTKKFTIEGTATECGKGYYVGGTTGQTCNGSYCQDTSRICVSCSGAANGGVVECSGKSSKDSVCAKIPFGGTINWSAATNPLGVFLIPVCGDAAAIGDKGTTKVSDVGDKMPGKIFPGFIVNTSKDAAGQTAYRVQIDSTLTDVMRNDCKKGDKGGPNGVVLGVVYHNNCEWKTQFAVSKASGESTTKAAVKSGECAFAPDQMAIVTKQDCAGASFQNLKYDPNYFSGYAMMGSEKTVWDVLKYVSPAVLAAKVLTPGGSIKDLISTAIWCGWTMKPVPGSYDLKKGVSAYSFRDPGTWDPKTNARTRFNWNGDTRMNPYWNYDEIEKAIRGEKPIKCDFDLTEKNAPRNAPIYLYGGCGVNWSKIKTDDKGGSPFPDKSLWPSWKLSDIVDFYENW